MSARTGSKIAFAFVLMLCPMAMGQSASARSSADDARLIALETSKWNPASLSGPKELKAMFADDFVSVEYGADTKGGVQRKTREQVFAGPPLPPAKFELSQWKAVHASPEVVILSYLVTGKTFPWKAYATTVWARRDGRWTSVFYQASTAR